MKRSHELGGRIERDLGEARAERPFGWRIEPSLRCHYNECCFGWITDDSRPVGCTRHKNGVGTECCRQQCTSGKFRSDNATTRRGDVSFGAVSPATNQPGLAATKRFAGGHLIQRECAGFVGTNNRC